MRILFTLLALLGFIGFGSSGEQTTADQGHKQSIILMAGGGDGYDDGG